MSTHPTLDATQTADRLHDWATGTHPMAAAVELLIRAFDGRFARPDQPWIRIEATGYVWLDDDALHANLGPLSGGERRVLEVVCALIEPSRSLQLADTLTGLDRTNLDLVLAACAHAAGSHEHAEMTVNPVTLQARITTLGSAHPWPRRGEPIPGLTVLPTPPTPDPAI